MTWYRKIVLSQMPPVWINKWTTYLRKNFELLMEHNPNRYEPYLIGSPEYGSVYGGIVVDIGMNQDIYKIVFKRQGDNLISVITLDGQVLPSRTFDMFQEKPYDIVTEIKEKIKSYSQGGEKN